MGYNASKTVQHWEWSCQETESSNYSQFWILIAENVCFWCAAFWLWTYKIKTQQNRSALSLSLQIFKTQTKAWEFSAFFQTGWVLLQNHNPTSKREIWAAFSMIFARPGFDIVDNFWSQVSTKCPLSRHPGVSVSFCSENFMEDYEYT